jgi:hypothetical protein
MEYRGIEFSIVQSIQRRKWRWSAAVPEIGFRTGLADSKDEAAMHARQAITWMLAAKKRQTENA